MTGQGNGHAGAAGVRPRGALLLAVGLALAGCGGPDGPGQEGAGTLAASASAIARGGRSSADVLAPEVFQVAEPGLWDGRPSLGGVWVAHPAAQAPERVRIVNRANGQEIVGALFRRERDLPGPALQVSSDAAVALGMLAGAPAELEVTALRREEAPAPEPGAPEGAPSGTEAAQALGAEPATTPAPDAPPAAAPAPDAPARPGLLGGLGRVFGGRQAAAPEPAPGAIATTSLQAPDAAPDPAAAPGARTYVQLGQFDVEANATDAASRLTAQGLPAGTVPAGGTWRLLLGPAATEAEQASLVEAAVAAGFADAYLVRL